MIIQQPTSLPHPKYRNIIFDLGAVLVFWNAKAILEKVFHGAQTIPYELVKATMSQTWYDYDKGIIDEQKLITSVATDFNIEQHLVSKFFYQVPLSLIPLELGSKMFFAAKKQGFRVYLLTNIGMVSFERLKKTTTFFKEADGYIASCEVKSVKPEPEIYQHLLQRYNLKPEECLFIDDLEANIKAGNALGIDGIVCQDHHEVIKQLNNQGIITI